MNLPALIALDLGIALCLTAGAWFFKRMLPLRLLMAAPAGGRRPSARQRLTGMALGSLLLVFLDAYLVYPPLYSVWHYGILGFWICLGAWMGIVGVPNAVRIGLLGDLLAAQMGIEHRARRSRLVAYTLLHGAVLLVAAGVVAGFFALMWQSGTHGRVLAGRVAIAVASAASALTLLLHFYRRDTRLDERLGAWVYGGAVPPLVWQATRQSVIFLWGGIGFAVLLIGGAVVMALTGHR